MIPSKSQSRRFTILLRDRPTPILETLLKYYQNINTGSGDTYIDEITMIKSVLSTRSEAEVSSVQL